MSETFEQNPPLYLCESGPVLKEQHSDSGSGSRRRLLLLVLAILGIALAGSQFHARRGYFEAMFRPPTAESTCHAVSGPSETIEVMMDMVFCMEVFRDKHCDAECVSAIAPDNFVPELFWDSF